MKRFRQIIFTIAMVIGLAFSVSAQKDDKKNRPPKGDPPKVDPGQKPPRGNPPKEDRPKKPGFSYLVSVTREDDIV
jgi:hypothetical protein